MMMNFLDLSAASEEERRLIREILSDTSIVNIAEPHEADTRPNNHNKLNSTNFNTISTNSTSNTSNSTKSSIPTTTVNNTSASSHTANLSSATQHKNRLNSNVNNHNNIGSTSNNISNSSSSGGVSGPSGSSNSNSNKKNQSSSNSSNNYNQRTYNNKHGNDRLRSGGGAPVGNHINNNSGSGNSNDSDIVVTSSSSVSLPSSHLAQTNNLDQQHNVNTMTTSNNVYNHHSVAAHHHNMHHQVPTPNLPPTAKSSDYRNGNSKTNQTNYPTQNTSMQTIMQATTHAGAQATTVPPTQAQMPPMQGDMNSVLGMDMSSNQPQGYAIPPHVTAFGPPPHRVYGGPPIFQPYHYLIPTHPYNPYLPYVALGPPNNVVPTRQQVPPQSNQPPSTSSATTNSLPRNSHLQNQQAHLESNRSITSNNTKTSRNKCDATSTTHHQNIQLSTPSSNNEEIVPTSYEGLETDSTCLDAPEQSLKNSKTTSEQPANSSPCIIGNKDRANQLDVQVTSTSTNGEEMVKLSSDDGFETQSSLDVSKQSYESSSIPISDQSKSSPSEKCDNSSQDKASRESINEIKSDSNSAHNHNNNGSNNNSSEIVQRSASDRGVWGSASSKSWADLFKRGGTASTGLSNGETEYNNVSGSENSDEENKIQRSSTSAKNDFVGKINSSASTSKEQRSQEAAKRALDKMAPRLAQKVNSVNLKHSLPFLKPRGFINKGNGCYINATLQALIACPPFYNLMKEIGVFRRENSCTPILDSFAELFLNFPIVDTNKKNKQSSPQEQKLDIKTLQAEAIEPKCIYKVLGEIKSECLKGAQEDAEEFLSSVLNGLHDEMIGLSEISQSTPNSATQNGLPSDVEDSNDDIANDDNLWREVGPKNRSLPIRTAKVINTPIQEIFGGSLFSIRTAGKDRCGHRSPFFDLQLDISSDNVKSVQDAIKSFTATEVIHDFYCTKTKQKLDAQRRTSLDQLPPILILHLKQFVYTQDHGLKKLMKKIEYPIDFEIPENCLHDKSSTDKNLKTSRSYKLLAVVYHDGKEAIKGHYLTDVYHIGSSQWIRCDDSNLKAIPSPRIENPDSTRTPYLLFYRRLNTLKAQTGNHDNKKKN